MARGQYDFSSRSFFLENIYFPVRYIYFFYYIIARMYIYRDQSTDLG